MQSDEGEIEFSSLQISLEGKIGHDPFSMKLKHDACHERTRFVFQDEKTVNTIHLCGRIGDDDAKRLHAIYFHKATVNAPLLSPDGNNQGECILVFQKPSGFAKVIKGSTRKESQCESHDYIRTSTWCASNHLGESNEFCCRRKDDSNSCAKTEIDDRLELIRMDTFTILSGQAMCVEFVLDFSPDVKTFVMHHANDQRSSLHVEASYDNDIANTYMLGNSYCLGDTLPEMHTLDDADKRKVILCTGKLADKQNIQYATLLKLTGILRYTVFTVSGNQIEKSKDLNMRLPRVKENKATVEKCEEHPIYSRCQQCEQTCAVMLQGSGFLKCKGEWYWYRSNLIRQTVIKKIGQIEQGESNRTPTLNNNKRYGDKNGGETEEEEVAYSHHQRANSCNTARVWIGLIWTVMFVIMIQK